MSSNDVQITEISAIAEDMDYGRIDAAVSKIWAFSGVIDFIETIVAEARRLGQFEVIAAAEEKASRELYGRK